jgi:glucose/arabinose dehydrogenase
MKYVNGTATDVTTIFTSPEVTGTDHVGGRLLFGPDGMLYLIIGDSQRSGNAQDTGTSFGKMLRMTSSGHTPSGNQYPGREWAIGIRNSYGFTFDFAHTGLMWETENGPECNDELNQIDGGNNQGWGPNENCDGTSPDDTNNSGPNPVFPLLWYTPTIAPTGAVFCDGCGLTGADGDLFFGTYNTANVHEITLTSDRTGVTGDSIVLTHSEGVLSMERGPDGTIYFSDSNAIYKLVNT